MTDADNSERRPEQELGDLAAAVSEAANAGATAGETAGRDADSSPAALTSAEATGTRLGAVAGAVAGAAAGAAVAQSTEGVSAGEALYELDAPPPKPSDSSTGGDSSGSAGPGGSKGPAEPPAHVSVVYDPGEHRESVRGIIAQWLVLILAGIVTAAFWLVVWKGNDSASALLQIVLGPVVALVGSATGFYFGVERAATAQNSGQTKT
jgi:hypothetical protein